MTHIQVTGAIWLTSKMVGRLLAQSSPFLLKSDGWVKHHIDIAVTAKAIGFTGETVVMDGNALLTLGIQFTCQQFGLQFLDDAREGGF